MADESLESMMTVKYSDKLQIAMQKKASQLRSRVTVHTEIKGKLYEVPMIGKRTMTVNTDGKGDTPDRANSFVQSWMAKKSLEDGYIHDRQFNDQSVYADLILSQTQDAQMFAANRAMDEEIVRGLLGKAIRGPQDALRNEDLPVSQVIDAKDDFGSQLSANGPMSFNKLRSVLAVLKAARALDGGQVPIMLVGVRQMMQLLDDERLTSADYNAVKALVNGSVDTFMGFKFIETECLPFDSETGLRRCVAYVPSAIDFGIWDDAKTEVTIRTDKKNCPQIYTHIGIGAVRNDDMGVVAIDCVD